MRPTAATSGFTLIEVMITVAIIAILAGIAYPSYQDQVRSSRRVAAMETLIKMQLAQEEYHLENGQYGSATDLGSYVLDHYSVSVTTSTSGYTLSVTAKTGSSQVKDSEGSTSCATLKLDQNDAQTPAECW
ncbi:type IV pilin protein [Ferrimonas pelagia]|uniref:Type IV pilin protein n=1 Tax=Ferrimonas pelagia TaxID=1177826 RepID=A0ABP9EG88_9GAMM